MKNLIRVAQGTLAAILLLAVILAGWLIICTGCAAPFDEALGLPEPAADVSPHLRYYTADHEMVGPYSNPFRQSPEEPRPTPLELWAAVHEHVTYLSDTDENGHIVDVWQPWDVTYVVQTGDCEDMSILLVNALKKEGYLAWLATGDIMTWHPTEGGHAWVLLYLNQRMYVLDPTNTPPTDIEDAHWLAGWWRNWVVWRIYS